MIDCNSDLIKMNNKLCDLYTKYCFEAFGINVSICESDSSFDMNESSVSGLSFDFKDA